MAKSNRMTTDDGIYHITHYDDTYLPTYVIEQSTPLLPPAPN